MAYEAMSWNDGEKRMHEMTKVPARDNPVSPGLTPRAANQIAIYPLMALGTTDLNDDDRPWTTLWGGEAPIAQPIAAGGIIGIRTLVDASFDPVINALLGKSDQDEIIKQTQHGGPMVSGLSIDLVRRSRYKLYGRMMAGALSAKDYNDDPSAIAEGQGRAGEVQLVLKIEQSLGNCPKYINKKVIEPCSNSKPQLISESAVLPQEAIDLIQRADMIFISSSYKHEDMDTNHRGGPPGFIRVQQPDPSTFAPGGKSTLGTVIVWPEYSGNNLYQSLGNLLVTPRAGIAIPDYASGDVVYLSGDTEVLFDNDANSLLPGSKLAVRFTTTRARYVKSSLGFRGKPVSDNTSGLSPYNPRIRYLSSEKQQGFNSQPSQATVKLIAKTKLTPTIYKYRFSLSDPQTSSHEIKPINSHNWSPGQHAALDFSSELNIGYSHMRDDDPTSLNDDFIRTFTIASLPNSSKTTISGTSTASFELWIRSVGPVTKWLATQREGTLEAELKGFGGDFRFENPNLNQDQRRGRKSCFIAGGIGITPLLSQFDTSDLHVLWTLSIHDAGLATAVLKLCPNPLIRNMTIFLTGSEDDIRHDDVRAKVQELSKFDVKVERRRLMEGDVRDVEGRERVDDWFLCTTGLLREVVRGWLPGRELFWEEFTY